MGIRIMVVRWTLTPLVGVRFSHPQPLPAAAAKAAAVFFSGHSADGSAPGSGLGGRGFKSRCSDQNNPLAKPRIGLAGGFFLVYGSARGVFARVRTHRTHKKAAKLREVTAFLFCLFRRLPLPGLGRRQADSSMPRAAGRRKHRYPGRKRKAKRGGSRHPRRLCRWKGREKGQPYKIGLQTFCRKIIIVSMTVAAEPFSFQGKRPAGILPRNKNRRLSDDPSDYCRG